MNLSEPSHNAVVFEETIRLGGGYDKDGFSGHMGQVVVDRWNSENNSAVGVQTLASFNPATWQSESNYFLGSVGNILEVAPLAGTGYKATKNTYEAISTSYKLERAVDDIPVVNLNLNLTRDADEIQLGDGLKALENNNARNEFAGPYSANTFREDYEVIYGSENVFSTTAPKNPHQRVNSNPEKNIEVILGDDGGKAVKVQYEDPKTGDLLSANIPYNDRGLPVFDDVSKFTTDIDLSKSYDGQMRQATRDLRAAIKNGEIDSSQFTALQLQQIKSGKEKIQGYTWHHNADSHNMQLIPEDVHDAASHVGQGSLGGKK